MADCPECGRPIDAHNRHIRLTYPDPIAMTEDRENADGFWMSHADAKTSVMMQAQGIGAFMRARLPVHLFGGYTVTYDLWLSIEPADLQYVSQIWDKPEYMQLVVEGVLANAVPPWGLLQAPVRARVRDRRHTPYCDFSKYNDLARVIANEWAHEEVLAALDAQEPGHEGHDH
ncbi:MAG: DUF2199 domain-containing protein [Frankiaceae bacterium]|nr:DUF2199 domain-containing protein [Frankiaceae bacterium]